MKVGHLAIVGVASVDTPGTTRPQRPEGRQRDVVIARQLTNCVDLLEELPLGQPVSLRPARTHRAKPDQENRSQA